MLLAGAVLPAGALSPAPGDGACVPPVVLPPVAPEVAAGVASRVAAGVAPGVASDEDPDVAPGVVAVGEDPVGAALGSALMTAMICSLNALSRPWISESGRFRRSLP